MVAKLVENWLDGAVDGAAFSGTQQMISYAGADADGRLASNPVESGLKGGQRWARDDLGLLHGLTGGRVEAGHILEDIIVPNNRKEPGHRHRDIESMQ